MTNRSPNRGNGERRDRPRSNRQRPGAEHAQGAEVHRASEVLDLVGVGFGPSNLALAIAAQELSPSIAAVFLERSPSFQWHPGMMLDGAVMQISFLKDLATLRNPASPYTYLQYVKARGRLERFVNLRDFYPTRLEYQDYLSWVAAAFADKVHYGTLVTRVSPVTCADGAPPYFEVTARRLETGETLSYFARNVVYAAGGKPRVPNGVACDGARILHSSNFLPGFAKEFSARDQVCEIAVTGDGQSAGEVVAYLLDNYPQARVHLLIAGAAPGAADDSHFVNEHFQAADVDRFQFADPGKRAALLAELRQTNYGVMEAGLIERIYRHTYLDEVRGRQRLFIHPFCRLSDVQRQGGDLSLRLQDRFGGSSRTLNCDGVILATGYERELDATIFADVLPHLQKDAAGAIVLSRHHRVQTTNEMHCGLYVQGFGESKFGLSDTLLSLLPFRAADILEDIARHSEATCDRTSPGRYPPVRHLEHSPTKLFAVMERFPFATVISAQRPDDVRVTHLPLVLDRTRGRNGTLFGHLDCSNPQVHALDGRRVTAIFHGPNSYISPHVYATDQLPTWNSINVHVRGKARIISDRAAIVAGLCRTAQYADSELSAFRLDPEDPRIDRLIGQIVAFELELDDIIGRFKLSQDRSESDKLRAGHALARRSEQGERSILEFVLGFPLRVLGCPGQSSPEEQAQGGEYEQ
ncbi:SidA/IucD/PvdA family monooxygenase (plasmid) [Rhizobium leguminosarum]